jgi:23S rRNA (adenine2503-C2)-methyltransferase
MPAEHDIPNALGMLPDAFADACVERFGWPRGRALRLYTEIFRTGAARTAPKFFDPAPLACVGPMVQELREDCPEGTVVKFLTRVDSAADEAVRTAAATRFPHLDVESVLIPMVGRKGLLSYTLCVSSQVGCAMGCTFCETAQMGLIRSLTPDEIVGQWFSATHRLGFKVSNMVFMGMGEPMDNYDNVIAAIAILKDHLGAGVPLSKITISTVGRVDGILKLKQKVHEPGWHRLGIALSLNAPNDQVRDAIMPVNRRWKLAEVREALLDWPEYGGNKINLEYVLIPGVNDSDEHAAQVADFYAPFKAADGTSTPKALVNLIPYNPRRDSPWPAPTEESIERFMKLLSDRMVYVKRRRTKGRQMMGACGQLGAAHIRQRKLVDVTVSGG